MAAQGVNLSTPKTAPMFHLDLDRPDYELRQIVRGTFRFELPEERRGLRVAVGLIALRDGEIIFEQTRTLDGNRDTDSGTYSFELRLPAEVKGESLMKRLKQAIKRTGKSDVDWEVWGILDKEICVKTAFHVRADDDDEPAASELPERGAPSPRSQAAASVLSRLNIPPPDYAPSGRAELDPKGKKRKPPEPALRTRDMSEYSGPARTKVCGACGAQEEDPESEYCGRCGKAL